MACVKCGYLIGDQVVCPKCGYKTQMSPQVISSVSLPDADARINPVKPQEISLGVAGGWRAELSERVKQIKERRSMETELDIVLRDSLPSSLPESVSQVVEDSTQSNVESKVIENPIIKAALDRVKRASENTRNLGGFSTASLASASDMTTRPLVINTATAPALSFDLADNEMYEQEDSFKVKEVQTSYREDSTQRADVVPFGWAKGTEESQTHASNLNILPEIVHRLRSGGIDALVLFLSNLPLWIAVGVINGNLQDLSVQFTLFVSAVLISGVYLFGTTAVAGQTFGMMYSGLRIVDVNTGGRITPAQALLRALGCILSTIIFMLGFIWVIFDREQRGLHEYISGTQVVYSSDIFLDELYQPSLAEEHKM